MGLNGRPANELRPAGFDFEVRVWPCDLIFHALPESGYTKDQSFVLKEEFRPFLEVKVRASLGTNV